MIIHKLLRELLFALFAIYNIQGWLYPTGSFLSRSCLLGIILISGIYFIKTLLIKNKNNLFYTAWTLFIILNITGFIFNPQISSGPAREMFKRIMGGLLPFYPFFYFATKDELKPNHMIRFFLVMVPIQIFQYLNFEVNVLLERSDRTDVVNNLSYTFVNMLPYIFLIKNKKVFSAALFAVLLSFVINGSKRGAIISGSIALFMYFYYMMKTVEKRNQIFGYVGFIIITVGLSIFLYKASLSNQFMIKRMTSILEGNTSGRDVLYGTIFNHWYYSDNIFNLIFGFGFSASVDIVGTRAHNDWLELLSNFGLIGIFAYLFLFYAAVKNLLNKEWMPENRILFMTIIMIWFFKSLVSMWYISLDGFFYCVMLGYLLAPKSKALE